MLSTFDRDLEMLDRLETDFIRALCYDFPTQFSGTYKSYEYSRLCTVIQGEKQVSVNSKEIFTYDRNRLLLLSPNSKIHMTIEQPTKAVVFELNNDLIKKMNEKVSSEYSLDYDLLSQNNYYVGNNSLELREILNKISREILNKGKNSEFLIDLYAQELVYHLIQNKGVKQVLTAECNNPINRAIRYMNSNYMRPVSISLLAFELNMSESGFCQYFKKITGLTANEYLTRIKLEKAKELLKKENVTEAAYDLGYANISYFISLFKREYGMTPKQYKSLL